MQRMKRTELSTVTRLLNLSVPYADKRKLKYVRT